MTYKTTDCEQAPNGPGVVTDITVPDAHEEQSRARAALAQFVATEAARFEEDRRSNYEEAWNRFYGVWSGTDTELVNSRSMHTRPRPSEARDVRFISPIAAQAVDMLMAEMQEALFGGGSWLDITDDDPDAADIDVLRAAVEDDAFRGDFMGAILDSLCYGAIYGTAILRVRAVTEDVPTVSAKETPPPQAEGAPPPTPKKARVTMKERERVVLEAVHPRLFGIDPAVHIGGTAGINAASGVCYTSYPATNWVLAQQSADVYWAGDLGPGLRPASSSDDVPSSTSTAAAVNPELLEYEGAVPARLLQAALGERVTAGEHDMVEARVIVANRRLALFAERNKRLRRERSFVAFALEAVPNRFWGRGAVEKAYHSQIVHDNIVNAQIQSIYESVYKPLVVDSTIVPQTFDIVLRHGQTLRIPGGSGAISELRKSGPDPLSFNITGELERYVNMATGATSSSAPLRTNRLTSTLGGVSAVQAGAAKRLKHVLRRAEGQFLTPCVEKICFFGMQYAPDRYPTTDMSFRVRTSLGLMAKEIEQQQATSLLQVVPPGTPGFNALLGSIVRGMSLPYREALIAVLSQPPAPKPGEEDAAIDKKLKQERELAHIKEATVRAEKTEALTASIREKTGRESGSAAKQAAGNQILEDLMRDDEFGPAI